MAGGTFDKAIGKVRPGTYVNFESSKQEDVGTGSRGIVLIPLIGHDYGPEKEFISITRDNSDITLNKLGYSINDDNYSIILIREALKNSSTVLVYIPTQGDKATTTASGLTATAKYGGTRGNSFRISIIANPIKGFDVLIYLDTTLVSEHNEVETIADLIAKNDEWINFEGTGVLVANAGLSLSGGTTGEVVVSDITDFLDKSESVKWDTLAFPIEKTGETNDPAIGLFEAVKSKIIYLREDAGKYRKAVIPDFPADYEGIINVTNSVALGDTKLSKAQITAWVAGADAGADKNESNTHKVYVGATEIIGLKSHSEAVSAINNGEFFFSSSEAGEIVVEYDINSLVTFDKPKDISYRKNRIIRVLDSLGKQLILTFVPNKFDNEPTGWDVMDGIGRSILKQFMDDGAIQNVDLENDFQVDRTNNTGDETYFNVAIQPVDSSEKLYFTIKTR